MSHYAAPVTERETVHEYLTVRQVHHRPDLETIRPSGEIDLVTAPTLNAVLTDTERRHVPNVVVDLTDVEFLALVGVQVLHAAADRAAGTDRRLVLVAPTPGVQRVLSLTDVTSVLATYVTLASAMSALALEPVEPLV